MKEKKATPKKAAVKKAEPAKKVTTKKTAPKEVKVKKQAVKPELSAEATEKQAIIEKFAQKKGDTGSPEVQVALLSFKITRLSEHLNINKKDNHSRRGLLKVVAKRRRILNYLQKLDADRYKSLIGNLALKK